MGLTPANLCWMEKLQIQLFYEHRRKLNMFSKNNRFAMERKMSASKQRFGLRKIMGGGSVGPLRADLPVRHPGLSR